MSIASTNSIKDISGNHLMINPDGSLKALVPSSGIVTSAWTRCTSASGGTGLPDVVCTEVTVQALVSNSGYIFVGGTGSNSPFSGKGACLVAGASITLRVNNFNRISCFATISGSRVTTIGEI